MKTLAIIPARAGSKCIEMKNLAPLAGLPLIAHTIYCAEMCPEIDTIVVSTDSPRIGNIAQAISSRVEVIYRPPNLADDDSPMWPVMRHVIGEYQYHHRALLLQPTSPLRLPEDISNALEKMDQSMRFDGVIGVHKAKFSPYQHFLIHEADSETVTPYDDYNMGLTRQELPVSYAINGSLYLFDARWFHGTREPWNGRLAPLVIPRMRAVDIDEPIDLIIAETLIKAGLVKLPWL